LRVNELIKQKDQNLLRKRSLFKISKTKYELPSSNSLAENSDIKAKADYIEIQPKPVLLKFSQAQKETEKNMIQVKKLQS
jgi:hypothetical protein